MDRRSVSSHKARAEELNCTFCLHPDININPKLCDSCQCWNDLTHMMLCTDLQYKGDGITYQAWQFRIGDSHSLPSVNQSGLEFRSPEDMAKAEGCLVCQTLLEGLQRHKINANPPNTALWRLCPGESFMRGWEKRQGQWTDKFIATFCMAYPQGEHDNSTTLEPGILEIELSYSDGLRGFKDIRLWDRRLVNIDKVKNWMSHCEGHHEMCKETLVRKILPDGFRVIDVEMECVVQPNRDIGGYIALSYQWDTATAYEDRNVMLLRSNTEELQTPRALASHYLPEVIQDSMQFCRDIGERYLWVDRLCIYQDENDADGLKQVQIDGMDAVYWLATVTLVASADGVGIGLPGVSHRPRLYLKNPGWGLFTTVPGYNSPRPFVESDSTELIEPSSWNTRGWTFQERWISRRLIFFGHSHCILNCFYFNHCEEEFKDDGTLKQLKRDMTHVSRYGTDVRTAKNESSTSMVSLYRTAVHRYTIRSLGLASDILNAFSGVNKFLVANLQTTSLFGLPETGLFQSLLWLRKNTPFSTPKGDIPQGIPSWSWASGYGPAEYNPYDYDETNVVHFWYSENGTVREVIRTTFSFDGSPRVDMSKGFEPNRSHEGSRRYVGEYKLPGLGIYRNCPHHSQEAIKHCCITEDSCAIAARTPGCLVFNTTVASLRVRVNEVKSSNALGPSSPSDMWERFSMERGHKKGRLITLDIIDDEGAKIGYTFHEVFPPDHKLPPIDGEYFRCHAIILRHSGSSWFVMIVDRKEHLSSRLAIGFVDPLLWKKVKPTWQTIFLV